jgi:hypothetical protein
MKKIKLYNYVALSFILISVLALILNVMSPAILLSNPAVFYAALCGTIINFVQNVLMTGYVLNYGRSKWWMLPGSIVSIIDFILIIACTVYYELGYILFVIHLVSMSSVIGNNVMLLCFKKNDEDIPEEKLETRADISV